MVNESWLNRTETQTRVITDALQYAESFADAQANLARYSGWMFWKKYPNGREYLVHAYDRTGKGTTLGARSKDSEQTHEQFTSLQADAKTRYALADERVKSQARFIKAAKLNRLPRQASAVVQALGNSPNGAEYVIVGTHALYAYEAMADVIILPHAMETQDIDVLWDAKRRVQTVINAGTNSMVGVVEVLKSIDKTFTTNTEKTFQARNAEGFVVDFLRPEMPAEPLLIAEGDRINPIALPGLDWLLKQTQDVTVFDYQGLPVLMRVPDPRLFAAHKMWLSNRSDRAPGKRDRDRMQATLVTELITSRKPVLDSLDQELLRESPEIFALLDPLFLRHDTSSLILN